MAESTSLAAALAQVEEWARLGRPQEAEQACMGIMQQWPGAHQGWAWLGLLRLIGQRYAEAEHALLQAIALETGDAQYWINAALALRGQGKRVDAEVFARQAVARAPASAGAWQVLGVTLFDLQRFVDAAEAYRTALNQDGANAGVWAELAAAEYALGRRSAAQEALEQSLAIAPGNAEVLTKYAMLLIEGGQAARGVELLRPVVEQIPQLAHAWLALGRAYRMLDDMPQSEQAFRQALQLVPGNREALHDLALVLLARFQLAEAESVVRRLVQDHPGFSGAWLLLGIVLHLHCRIDEALPPLRRAVELAPAPLPHSKLLVSLAYGEGTTPDELLAEHIAWDAAHARNLAPIAPASSRSERSGSRLRLGFVACDFAAGPTAFLALPLLESLDKTQCTVHCYSDRLREDEYSQRFRAVADSWQTIVGQSDEAIARQICADGIDVLFDLAGHVSPRLLVFARRPAPLQVTWLGYVGTTGLKAMDYLLADPYHVRAGEERWYVEQVLRMPHSYACYGPPRITPDVGPLPVLASGQFTFGCFNNPVKFTAGLLDSWGQILNHVPGSRMLLKYFGLDQPHLQAWLREQFGRRGVAESRILCEGWSPHLELLAAYSRVDLALDTQPYAGGLTTCESLWMGVPVVTYPGKTFAGRHATSYLSSVGLPHCVAEDRAGYVDSAVGWAQRLDELATIRNGLREQMRQSPVCDGPRFARDFLAQLRQVWEQRVRAT